MSLSGSSESKKLRMSARLRDLYPRHGSGPIAPLIELRLPAREKALHAHLFDPGDRDAIDRRDALALNVKTTATTQVHTLSPYVEEPRSWHRARKTRSFPGSLPSDAG